MSEICIAPIDCETISPEAAFKNLIQEDENGNPALNTIEVTGTNTLFVTCDNTEENWKSLFFNMIALDENQNWALKIIKSNPA